MILPLRTPLLTDALNVALALPRLAVFGAKGLGQLFTAPSGRQTPPMAAAPERPARRDHWRQGLNLALAAAQIVTPAFSRLTGLGAPIEQLSDRTNTWVTPANGAFAIWGFIYPACLAYGVFQALPAQRERALLRRLGWWSASAFLANAVWPLVFELELYWPSVLVIAWTLVSLMGAVVTFARHRGPWSRAERALAFVPLSVFAAWITVATILNTALTLQAAGIQALLPGETWGVLLTLAAGAIGAFVTRAEGGRNLPYGVTVLWALGGIYRAKARSSAPIAAATLGSGLLVTAALARPAAPA